MWKHSACLCLSLCIEQALTRSEFAGFDGAGPAGQGPGGGNHAGGGSSAGSGSSSGSSTSSHADVGLSAWSVADLCCQVTCRGGASMYAALTQSKVLLALQVAIAPRGRAGRRGRGWGRPPGPGRPRGPGRGRARGLGPQHRHAPSSLYMVL